MPLQRLELETSGFDTMMERIMACIPPNPRRVGYIDPIRGPLDGPLYMGSHIHQQ